MPVKSAFQAFFNDCIQLSKYNVYRNQKLVIVKQKGSRQVLLATTSLDGSQKIFNLAVSIRQFIYLNEYESSRVRTWLKLMMLNIATSYRINECGRTFKSEYIISQAVMMACKKLGYDGVAYFSKRVADEVFAQCAINLALFVNYKKEYSDLVRHMKVDDAFNFSVYKNLNASATNTMYSLRSVNNGLITNIGSYDRQLCTTTNARPITTFISYSAKGNCFQNLTSRLPPEAYFMTKQEKGYEPRKKSQTKTVKSEKAVPLSKRGMFTKAIYSKPKMSVSKVKRS